MHFNPAGLLSGIDLCILWQNGRARLNRLKLGGTSHSRLRHKQQAMCPRKDGHIDEDQRPFGNIHEKNRCAASGACLANGSLIT